MCHDELFADIRNVIGDVSYDEMSNKLYDLELLFECNNIDYAYLIRTVVRAFSLLATIVSGSPIIQNGRIVGAVTHVLVNGPTRGYGIFLENMLEHN